MLGGHSPGDHAAAQTSLPRMCMRKSSQLLRLVHRWLCKCCSCLPDAVIEVSASTANPFGRQSLWPPDAFGRKGIWRLFQGALRALSRWHSSCPADVRPALQSGSQRLL